MVCRIAFALRRQIQMCIRDSAMYEEKIKEQGGEIHYNTIGQYLVRDDDGKGRVSARCV